MPKKIKTPEDIKNIASEGNIADRLDDKSLNQIGEQTTGEYEDDFGRMSEAFTLWDEIEDLAMQVREPKNWPWENASNVKYPIITDACIKFGAKIYADIVETGNVAKMKVNGRDPQGIKADRGGRVAEYTNFTLSDRIPNWEQDMDILLCLLPLYGCYYKKLYYSRIERRPVVEIRNPRKVITSPDSHLMEENRRVSDIFMLDRNSFVERVRAGLFRDVDLNWDSNRKDNNRKTKIGYGDEEKEFVEQHCWLDLDEDGYEEPYVVTTHYDTQQVLRIVPRFTERDVHTTRGGTRATNRRLNEIAKIDPFCHFVKYYFWPSFDGSILYMGLGQMLIPLNETINTTTNQLIDSGTLHNLQSGFLGRGIRMEGGPFRMAPGQWQPIEGRGGPLKDNVFPLPTKEPSRTLFELLGMMIEAAKELAMAKDIAPTDIPTNTPATSVLAAIEEGIKIYSSVYKRIYRSLRQELKKVYYLTSMFGNPEDYIKFLDDEEANFRQDYNLHDFDVTPSAPPEISSDMQRMLRAQALVQLLDSQGAMASGIDPRAIMENYLKAMKQPHIERILPPPPDPATQPPPIEERMLDMQADLEQQKRDTERAEVERKTIETEIKADKTEADIAALHAKGIKDIAEAEAAEAGQQLNEYQAQMNEIREDIRLGREIEAEEAERTEDREAETGPKTE